MQANFNMDKVNEDHLVSPVISTVLNYLPFGLGESGADCISRALASYIREKLVGGYTKSWFYKQAVHVQHGRDSPARLGRC